MVVNGHSGLEHPLGGCGLRLLLFTFGKCYVWPGAGSSLLEPDEFLSLLSRALFLLSSLDTSIFTYVWRFSLSSAIPSLLAFLLSIIFLVTKYFFVIIVFFARKGIFCPPLQPLEPLVGFFVRFGSNPQAAAAADGACLCWCCFPFQLPAVTGRGPAFWQGVAVAAAVSLPWPMFFF